MSEKASEWIDYKLADGVATITFIAPQFNNALGLKGLQEFLNALYRAEADDAVGAVVVTGRGKAFCAGFNLKEVPVKDLDVETGRRALSRACDVVASDPASVHPHAQANPGSGQRRCGRLRTGDDTLCRHGGLQGYSELLSGVAHHRHRQRRHHQLLACEDRRVPPRDGMDDDQSHGVRERSSGMERSQPRLR